MEYRQIFSPVFILCLTLAQVACGGDTTDSVNAPKIAPRVGCLAPDFSLKTPDGNKISLKELRGTPVFLIFFQITCEPCKEEMPDIQYLHEKYSDEGLKVFGVDQGDTAKGVNEYQEQMGISFPLLLDRTNEISKEYYVFGTPQTFFIDKDGIIQSIYIGKISRDQMEVSISIILK